MKEANYRYRKSPEGRANQRNLQSDYRKRQCDRAREAQKKTVMDQGSILLPAVSVSVCQGSIDHPTADLEEKTMAFHVSGRPRCVICGRVGRFVNPFFFKRRHYP
jgi:hypothetical protein